VTTDNLLLSDTHHDERTACQVKSILLQLTSAASAPTKGPDAADAATPLLSSPSRPLMTVGRYTLACRWCVASGPVKPSACAPLSGPAPLSSATAANGFAASPNSRVSSTSATSPGRIAEPRATLPFVGRTRCSPTSRTASWPPIAVGAKHLPRYLGAFAWRFQPPLYPENHPRAARHRRNQPPRQCPTASSNSLRLDGRREICYQD
jgi:hypothetical protein